MKLVQVTRLSRNTREPKPFSGWLVRRLWTLSEFGTSMLQEMMAFLYVPTAIRAQL